uniref:EF-hand domain-containing protein n=1 Tax=Clastoptera arizonana TaxID=38151 RepID=A0A1B6C3R8_9HEMI
MTISSFRLKKLMYVFNIFFDVNRSGSIDRKDFELAIDRICESRGWKEGDPLYTKTRTILFQVWDGLKARADSDNDGQVSHEEWCTMWDQYAQNPGQALDWQKSYMDFMFDLEDTSGDGAIDEIEFASVCADYGISKEDAVAAFRAFSSNGTVEVNREKYEELWKEYFSSEDPNAPGNFILGITNFQ